MLEKFNKFSVNTRASIITVLIILAWALFMAVCVMWPAVFGWTMLLICAAVMVLCIWLPVRMYLRGEFR